MAARDLLKALAAGVLGALLRSTRERPDRRETRGQGTGKSGRSAQAGQPSQPRLRAQSPRATTSAVETRADGSAGQFGAGATRELSAQEIATLAPSYEPHPDGDPDPGEIVWTWVPYAENDGRGKDRPVLIIARTSDGAVAGCYLSTKQHRGFISVGAGPWDSQGRESFLSPERVLRVTEEGMRREGHVLDRNRFVGAVTALARVHRFGRDN